jgi:hypothetical protein
MESIEDYLLTVKSYSQELYNTLVQLWGEMGFDSYIKNRLVEMEDKENFILASALLKLEKEHSSLFPEYE